MSISIEPGQLQEIMESIFPNDMLTSYAFDVQKHLVHSSKVLASLNPILRRNSLLKQDFTETEAQNRMKNILFRCPIGEQQTLKQLFQKLFGEKVVQPIVSRHFENSFFPNLRCTQILSPKRKTKIEISGIQANNVSAILQELYFDRGLVTNIQRLLLSDPDLFLKNYQYQMILFQNETNQLSSQQAYFIGIISAAQYGCIYLVNRMLKMFIQAAGETLWLKGQIPGKFQKIQELSHLLAHCPWRINQDLIDQLRTHWKYTQILHAAKIMTYCHYLSTLALCFGLEFQEHPKQLQKYFDIESLEQYKSKIVQKPQKCLLDELKVSQYMIDVLNNQFLQDGRRSNKSDSSETMEDSQQKLKKITQHMLTIDQEIKSSKKFHQIRKTFKLILCPCEGIIKRENTQIEVQYQSEWNLQQNGFSVMHPISEQTTDALFALINFVKSMNVRQLTSEMEKQNQQEVIKDLNCSIYRKSIEYYSDSFLGFIHDGYDYSTKMKTMLRLQERFFIMVNTLYPYLFDRKMKDYVSFPSTLHQEESLFILINLIANNKMERSLTYFTKYFRVDD